MCACILVGGHSAAFSEGSEAMNCLFSWHVPALASLKILCISSQKIAIHCVVGDESTEGGVGYL